MDWYKVYKNKSKFTTKIYKNHEYFVINNMVV